MLSGLTELTDFDDGVFLEAVEALGHLAEHGAQETDLGVLLLEVELHGAEATLVLMQEVLDRLVLALCQVLAQTVRRAQERAAVLVVTTLDVAARRQVLR